MSDEAGQVPQEAPRDAAPDGPPPSATQPGEHPTKLGGFEIIETVGQGGMGTVYKARQVSMDRPVALKILSRKLAGSKAFVQRFVREARAAAKLNHPNIVQGIDVGKSGGYYYFAMEFIDGRTAHDKLRAEGPLGELEAVRICAQIAKALHHAHERAGIIHRDVKPQNILLDEDGVAKLADLGLARHTDQQGDPSLTSVGMTLGTPDYISPEQIRGDPDLDGRCDIYSLGATLYHLLTGRPAYIGASSNVIMAKHLTEKPPNVRAERADISSDTTAIIRKAMQKDCAGRYQTAEAMAAALEVVLRRGAEADAVVTAPRSAAAVAAPAPAHVVRPRAERGSPLVLWLVAAARVVVVGVAIAFVGGSDDTPREKPPVVSPRPRPDPPRPKPRPKPPTPPPPKGPPAGQAAYNEALRVVRENKGGFRAVIPRLRVLYEACRDTPYEARIETLLEGVIDQARTEVVGTLQKLKDRSGQLLKERKYAEAIAVYAEVPEILSFGRPREAFQDAHDEVRGEVDQAYRNEHTRARGAAATGDFDKAIAIMQGVAAWGLPDLKKQAEASIQEFEAKREERAKQARFAAIIDYMGRVFTAMKKRDYAMALQVATVAEQDKRVAADSTMFRKLGADIRLCESLWDEAERRLLILRPGDSIRLRGIKREFVKYEKGQVTVAGSSPVALRSMRDVDLFEILKSSYNPRGADPVPHLQRGLFYTFDTHRQLDKTNGFYDLAQKAGDKPGADRGRYYVSLVGRIEPEQAALLLLADARKADRARQWTTVLAKLEQLEKHADTDTFKESAVERAELMFRAATRGRGLGALFSGASSLDEDGRITIRYDLGNQSHRGDWRGGTPRAAGLRSTRELRWNANIRPSSVKLTLRFPDRVDRTELRLMCNAQGGKPLITAVFGAYRGTAAYFLRAGRQQARKTIRAGDAVSMTVTLSKTKASLIIGGKTLAEANLPRTPPGGWSIYLVSYGVPVDVLRATVMGKLDMDWAKERAALLADVAVSKRLGEVKVAADKQWIDTKLKLAEGKYYYVRATGRWQYGRAASQGASAVGTTAVRAKLPLGALLGQVGKETFYVGEEIVLGPYRAGPLKLGINDEKWGLRDNSGALAVVVRELPRTYTPAYVPGLLAECYSGTNFGRLKHRKVSANMAFKGRELETLAGQRDQFSIRWRGYLKVPETGNYELGFSSDDGFRMWLDGKKILDIWRTGERNKATTKPIPLTKGYHRVRIEYYEAKGSSHLGLYWRRPGGKGMPIPAGVLFHSQAK